MLFFEFDWLLPGGQDKVQVVVDFAVFYSLDEFGIPGQLVVHYGSRPVQPNFELKILHLL